MRRIGLAKLIPAAHPNFVDKSGQQVATGKHGDRQGNDLDIGRLIDSVRHHSARGKMLTYQKGLGAGTASRRGRVGYACMTTGRGGWCH